MTSNADPFSRVSIPKAGRCSICSEPCLLIYIDNPTSMRFGRCCLWPMVAAEALILINRSNGGPRPPKPGELRFIDNH